jgi:hypothetical protein
VAEIPDLPTQPVTRRPGLEADVQSIIPLGQLLDYPFDRRRPVLDLTEESDLAAAAALGNRYRMFHLRHVERDESLVILSHGSPSVREARLGPCNPRLSTA